MDTNTLLQSKQITWTADHGSGFRYTVQRLARGDGRLFVQNPETGELSLIDTFASYENFVANYIAGAASVEPTTLEVL